MSAIQNQARLMKNTPITKSDLVSQVMNVVLRMKNRILMQIQHSKRNIITGDDIDKHMEVFLYTKKITVQVKISAKENSMSTHFKASATSVAI